MDTGRGAFLDIRLSARLFLIIEGISMAIILVLLAIILGKSHAVFDSPQLHLSATTFHGTVLGVVFFVLAFGGFEGAATLGLESKEPRRAVPVAPDRRIGRGRALLRCQRLRPGPGVRRAQAQPRSAKPP